MQIIHSPRVYREYIEHRCIFSEFYKDEVCCGVNYETDWKWDGVGTIFRWNRDYFKCRPCNFEVKVWNSWTDHDLTEKQLKEIVKHIQDNHFVLLKRSIKIQKEQRIGYQEPRKKLIKGDRFKHPLKPWQDPESLFCDTEFLEKFLGKKPTKGKECKDNHRE